MEYARIGAIKGIVTYADSSTLNLFDFFEISAPIEIDFDLDNANPASGALRRKCAGLVRTVSDALGGIPFSGLRAICGDAFFDDLLAHVEVRATYIQHAGGRAVRGRHMSAMAWFMAPIDFGGIVWENYRGAVGGTTFVDTDKCHFFPEGVPNLFRTYLCPADYIETVNRTGQRMYVKQYAMDNDKGINVEVQGNWLNICTRPNVLFKGRRT